MHNKLYINTYLKEISEISQYLWERGWAEKNAGNVSVNITDVVDKVQFNDFNYTSHNFTKEYNHLGGEFILLSGSGKRMRDIARQPENNLCIIQIDEIDTSKFRKYDLNNDISITPTSELPTHIAIHNYLKNNNKKEKLIIHAHTTELCALTQLKEYKNEENINNLLWGMHPETITFVPDGVGFAPYTLPGSEDIAEKTLYALENHKIVLWEKHGVYAIGDDFNDAFDLIDILNKSAKIFFLCKNSGNEAEGLSKSQIRELKEKFIK